MPGRAASVVQAWEIAARPGISAGKAQERIDLRIAAWDGGVHFDNFLGEVRRCVGAPCAGGARAG
eukprot:2914396-Alexandrium_andersonii.AAC.1